MGKYGMTEQYQCNKQKGDAYSVFICEQLLFQRHIRLDFCNSFKNQCIIGETLQGIEIKFDSKWPDTKNLYIELQEKSNQMNREYVDSGINRTDNTWLYIIGNYDKAWALPKKQLKHYLLNYGDNLERKELPTSRGIVLPIETVEREHLAVFEMEFTDSRKE